MRSTLSLALLASLTFLVACGVTPASNSSNPTPIPAVASLAGDWLVLPPLGTSIPSASIVDMMGALQVNGNAITGTFRAISLSFPPCVPLDQDLAVTGSYSNDGTLTLTIPIAGGTATVTGLATPKTYNAATLQITGGSCAMPSTGMQIAQFPPIIGTYSGTMSAYSSAGTIIAGSAINVSANLAESTAANADGQFPLTGTITATGGCSGTFALSGYFVSGGVIQQPPGASSELLFIGGTPPSGAILAGDFLPPSCTYGIYTGALVLQ